jgi:dynein heavy chain
MAHTGDIPSARSGHSMTFVSSQYVMFGGINVTRKNGKIVPCDDTFLFRIGKGIVNKLTVLDSLIWTKEDKFNCETPLARTQHTACAMPKDRLFLFGGHHTPSQRLNDVWVLQLSNMEWKHPEGQDLGTPRNQESPIGAPPPRANTSSCLIGNKIYIFGGHGGSNYQRIAFNDMFAFDCDTYEWEKVEYVNSPPEPRGGHSMFNLGNKIYVYGGWNSESQFNNIILFDTETGEWSDPDVYNEIPRWNHSSIMVEAIPSWKYFIFGGEVGDFPEGGPRHFGTFCNSSCVLDIETWHWTNIVTEDAVGLSKPFLPSEREYSAVVYDSKDSRLIIFGGWQNEWLDDVYSLNVSSIVGPSYAITEIIPSLGQLSGNTIVIIKGVGFKETNNITVRFVCGKQFVDVSATFVDETTLDCVTPSFEHIGPKESEVRLSIQGGDLTTTVATFSYFMNTRAYKSLAYGPGLLDEGCIETETEFLIQARNDLDENRKSGRDNFVVKITTVEDEPKEIPTQITDKDDGSYNVKYVIPEPCDCKIEILFEDDKGTMVAIRGSPYKSNFSAKSQASSNVLTGPAMQKYIQSGLEDIHQFIIDTTKGANIKDKNIEKDVKELIGVKEHVESVYRRNDEIVLYLDCLEESLKMFQQNGMAKDSQIKGVKKLFEEWNQLKKVAKDTKKEIAPFVSNESEKNNNQIKKLEEELKVFTADLKKRDFYYYKTGVVKGKALLGGVDDEIKKFELKIEDFGYNSDKFGQPDLITNSQKSVETIKIDMVNMNALWGHIEECLMTFDGYMTAKWNDTDPFAMEEEVKKLMKTLKDMKVDRKCNAYLGIMDEIKKWLILLPMIGELRTDAMRERHWQKLRDEVKQDFTVDDKLTLRDVFNLNLNKYQEAVEEITDQARQEAKMEKTLNKLEEIW